MLCLTRPTDPQWVAVALSDLSAVLVDHAHCEMKAASNAMSLALKPPGYPAVMRGLTELAEEELRHFRAVIDELERRGLSIGKPPPDEYAAELRRRIHIKGDHSAEGQLRDRLLIAALIEARSCERFQLLASGLRQSGQAELAAFYEDLMASEARHFRQLVDLAIGVRRDEEDVRRRLKEIAEVEGALSDELGRGASIHG